MSQETFLVTLGGRTWALPHLPFRVLKKAQPMLLRRSVAIAGEPAAVLATLDEAALDDLAEAAYLAVGVVEPALTREAFLDLPFSTGDLMGALPSLLGACGLKVGRREAGEGDEEKKASTGTPSTPESSTPPATPGPSATSTS